MEKSKIIVCLAIQLMQKRNEILKKHLYKRHSNFVIACERRQRRLQIILETFKSDNLLLIANVVLKERRKRRFKARPRSDHYWTLIKEPQNEELYFESMRMKKSSFLILCDLIKPYLVKQKLHLTVPVSPEKQIAICLYKLASCAEYRVVGDVFGVHKSTVHKYFYIVVNAILKLTKEFIVFPNLEECIQIAKRFDEISSIPNIIGSIDG